MLKFLRVLLVVCTVLPLAWTKNEEYIGRACYVDRTQPEVVGECVDSEQCGDNGTFVEDGAGLINPRKDQTKATIDCPSSLTCCLPAAGPATAAPAPTPEIRGRSGEEGCGWLQQGTGTALPGRAKPQEVPWIVGIYKLVGTDTSDRPVMEFIANGVLIHPMAVLTVAHKSASLQPAASVYCVVGDHDQLVTSVSRKVRQARAVRVHESFNDKKSRLFLEFLSGDRDSDSVTATSPWSFLSSWHIESWESSPATAEHNIALISLSLSAVEPLSHVAPVCLPPQGHVVAAGTTCFFSGWGKDTHDQHQTLLSKTEVPVISRSACAAALRPSLGLYFEVQPTLTCAGGVPNTDLCTGGAGSPLVCPIQGQPGRYQLAGLVVYVAACGPAGLPAVFTDVAALRAWVDAQLTAEGLTAPSY